MTIAVLTVEPRVGVVSAMPSIVDYDATGLVEIMAAAHAQSYLAKTRSLLGILSLSLLHTLQSTNISQKTKANGGQD